MAVLALLVPLMLGGETAVDSTCASAGSAGCDALAAKLVEARALFSEGCEKGDSLSCVYASWAHQPADRGDAVVWRAAVDADGCLKDGATLGECASALSSVGRPQVEGRSVKPLLAKACELAQPGACEAADALAPLEVAIGLDGFTIGDVTQPWCETEGFFVPCLYEGVLAEYQRRHRLVELAGLDWIQEPGAVAFRFDGGLDFDMLRRCLYSAAQTGYVEFDLRLAGEGGRLTTVLPALASSDPAPQPWSRRTSLPRATVRQ